MVAFLATYLFNDVTHLSDIYERKENKTIRYWTLPYVPGTRSPKSPAYVLTSKFTFSGAEDFAYNLKQLKHVTVVGETTGGGAHPVKRAQARRSILDRSALCARYQSDNQA